MVDANELKVINELSRRKDLTQRELAQRTRLSLGAVNIIIKRLVKRGLLKTLNLSPRKAEYLITPKGFSEKTKKSYNYILKTVDLVKRIKEEIARIVLDEYNRGQKRFIILGHDDLADIIELALKGFAYERVDSLAQIKEKDPLVLIGKKGLKANGFRSINLGERLNEQYWGVE
ncbi:MAG: winged helix-turn-helix transcriptional regulator [Candidatus Margulisbacteria bacterium]|jgi:DNA-binding MarR family transcriptional regulator|nr:winged helix-turn-helix transcriptional regulator [Candidatus Margulisiibacteriota bacterium]